MIDFSSALARCPLVAILRGLEPEEAAAIGATLVEKGFSLIEVPLNSPQPLLSIEMLARRFSDRALIGAGTVMSAEEVARVAVAGGRLVVSPHCDPTVIRAAKVAGLACVPGVATPSEAFTALAAGADALKAFPAEAIPPAAVKAWGAVLPKGTKVLPVGGIDGANMKPYLAAGAAGFGLGSSLYKPGDTPTVVATKADRLLAAFAGACA